MNNQPKTSAEIHALGLSTESDEGQRLLRGMNPAEESSALRYVAQVRRLLTEARSDLAERDRGFPPSRNSATGKISAALGNLTLLESELNSTDCRNDPKSGIEVAAQRVEP